MTELRLEWGVDGLKKALGRKDNIVIIDQLRFSSSVVNATSLGFTIEPTADKMRRTESFTLSPSSFLGKEPRRVIIESPNGAYLSLVAKDGKRVIYGSVLNAKAVAIWIDKIDEDTTLVVAGEVDPSRRLLMKEKEQTLAKGNEIFAMEDLLGAGAISYYSKMKKSDGCAKAEELFKNAKENLIHELKNTASHRYNESRGKGEDTTYYGKLNQFNVVPTLYFVKGIPEIRAG